MCVCEVVYVKSMWVCVPHFKVHIEAVLQFSQSENHGQESYCG